MPDPAQSLPVVPKSSSQPGMQPTPAELVPAELAMNAGDGILYGRMADGTVLPVRARPLGGYGRQGPGTFDGGCCPPVVTETGEVIPGVISQPTPGGFGIIGLGCNSASACSWFANVLVPSGVAAEALVLQGETRTAAGELLWADIAYTQGPFARGAVDRVVGVRVDCDKRWFILHDASNPAGSAQSVYLPALGAGNAVQPTGRLRVVASRLFALVGDVWVHDGPIGRLPGGHPLPPVSAEYMAPNGLPSRFSTTYPGCCVCEPPEPPDYGAYFVVDDGPTTRYDCVGGACVQKAGRAYSVRFGTTMVWPPDGVTSFATEAEALARAAALTSQDGQYATLAACETACVAGAWVLTLAPVTYYACSPACSTPLTWNKYTGPVFTPGAVVNAAQLRYATQQEALAIKQAADVVPGFPSQAQCESACTVYWKCDPAPGYPNRCSQVESASVSSALASGTSVHKTADQCAAVCGAAQPWTRAVVFCTNVNTSEHATFLSQLGDLARSYVDRGYSAAVSAVSVPGSCHWWPPGNGSVAIQLRCDGTEDFNDLGDPVSLLQYEINAAAWFGPVTVRATRCHPNPAP